MLYQLPYTTWEIWINSFGGFIWDQWHWWTFTTDITVTLVGC